MKIGLYVDVKKYHQNCYRLLIEIKLKPTLLDQILFMAMSTNTLSYLTQVKL